MAKRDGFVPIHHDGLKVVSQVPQTTVEHWKTLGWKAGDKNYQKSAKPDTEKES